MIMKKEEIFSFLENYEEEIDDSPLLSLIERIKSEGVEDYSFMFVKNWSYGPRPTDCEFWGEGLEDYTEFPHPLYFGIEEVERGAIIEQLFDGSYAEKHTSGYTLFLAPAGCKFTLVSYDNTDGGKITPHLYGYGRGSEVYKVE